MKPFSGASSTRANRIPAWAHCDSDASHERAVVQNRYVCPLYVSQKHSAEHIPPASGVALSASIAASLAVSATLASFVTASPVPASESAPAPPSFIGRESTVASMSPGPDPAGPALPPPAPTLPAAPPGLV